MSAWLPLSAILASVMGGALRDDSHARYWGVALCASSLFALGYALSFEDPGPPGNSPGVLAIAFIFFPTTVTFVAQRTLLRRRSATVAAFLALPLGLATFAAGVFIAMTLSVNAGILSP